MGRNARKRAEEREEHRNHGVEPDEASEVERPRKCPRCGSTNLVVAPYMAGVTKGLEIICGDCNWQGMIQPGIW